MNVLGLQRIMQRSSPVRGQRWNGGNGRRPKEVRDPEVEVKRATPEVIEGGCKFCPGRTLVAFRDDRGGGGDVDLYGHRFVCVVVLGVDILVCS